MSSFALSSVPVIVPAEMSFGVALTSLLGPSVQSLRQPSPPTLLLSSQVSPVAISKTPLPHVSSLRQSALQPSPPRLLPSSQRSPTATSTTPLPHVSSLLQSALQPSVSAVLPSSQISP